MTLRAQASLVLISSPSYTVASRSGQSGTKPVTSLNDDRIARSGHRALRRQPSAGERFVIDHGFPFQVEKEPGPRIGESRWQCRLSGLYPERQLSHGGSRGKEFASTACYTDRKHELGRPRDWPQQPRSDTQPSRRKRRQPLPAK